MRRIVASAALALVLAALATAAHAQSTEPGWIGISYESRSSSRGPRIVITEVRRGSPAESAGIRPGDRLVAIGELTGAEQLLNASRELDLRAGQPVQLRLERDGRPLELSVRAVARPVQLFTDASARQAFQTDSMVETMFRAMDSLRVQLLETTVGVAPVASGRAQARVIARARAEAVSAPFEFFVFRGEQHDSLVRAMERLNREMQRLRAREAERVQELSRSPRGQRAEEQDARLRELRQALDDLAEESAALESTMAAAARATAGIEYLMPPTPRPSPAPVAPQAEAFRPLTPYLLGSNRVAGAQVIEVQPELGAYFGVERGLLVVDVSPGTPASIAGLRAGDVITRLDQVGVRTVEELRLGVSQAGDTLPVTVVRQGSSLQVLLRRR
jgi:predicted metalloprotease with PDZ domain